MRVISGLKKGHKLKQPKTKSTRPTEDRIKESIFNIIGAIGEESVVVDFFAGSGAIGIEFLSRGVKKAYFVDDSNEAIKTIEENLQHTNFLENSIIMKMSNKSAVTKMHKQEIIFDYVFMDPPFEETSLIEETLELLDKCNLLNKDSLIIIEHKSEYLVNIDKFENYMIHSVRKYGNKTITFLSYK